MKTVSEQIKDLEATRAAKAARAAAVMQKSMDEGRSSDEEEAKEFDEIQDEIKTIDADLVRLKQLEAIMASTAAPVRRADTSTAEKAAHVRSGGLTVIAPANDPEEKFAGQMFTRLVIARTLAALEMRSGRLVSAAAIAEQRWGKSHPKLVEFIKANEVASGGTGSGEWGAELVAADARYTGDFITYLNSKTVYNRLPLREIPHNVTIKGQDGVATGYWVGESKAIPVSKADFFDVTLTPLQVAALAVISKRLLRDSSPSAESLVRDALVEAAAQRIDSTFLSTSAASAGVSPAGLLNGISAIASAGTLAGAVREDVKALLQTFITAKNLGGLHWVMQPGLATSLSLMVNALGQREFPDITEDGGTFFGKPVVTGDNVGAGDLILCKPSDIYKIGATGIEVSLSQDATIEMSSAPAGAADVPTGGTENPVSMFQTESVAVKVVQSMNFAKRRASAVAYVGDADYNVAET